MDSTGLTTLMDAHLAGREQRLVVRGPPRVARRAARVRPRRRRPPAGRVAFTARWRATPSPQPSRRSASTRSRRSSSCSRASRPTRQLGRLLQPPVRGHLPARRHGPRGDLPLRRRAPARPRGGRLRHPARRVRRRPGDGRDRRRSRASRCVEDRVIEISSAMAEGVPDEFRDLIRESTLVCTPMAAAGRWLGVILVRPRPGPPAAARLRALPAVDARQDRRAGRASPAWPRTSRPRRASCRSGWTSRARCTSP